MSQNSTPHEQIQEVELGFDRVFASATDGMLMLNSRDEITHINNAFAKLSGCTARELQGRPWLSLLVPPESTVPASEAPDASLGASTFSELILAGSNSKTVSWTKTGLSGVALIIVREERARETKLSPGARQEDELRRLAELAEQEKAKAIVGAQVADHNSQLKTEFLATMSHEIRTPLNSVIGMTEILLDSSLDSDQYEYVDTIRNSAHVLLSLINDVLDLSKIEVGRLTLEALDFDLMKMAEEVEQELAWSAKSKGVQFLFEVDRSVPHWVNGDSVRVRQVLTNLVANAVKFTDQGQIVAKISSTGRNQKGVQLCFSVEDTGIGISPSDLQKLFQPFMQVDSTTTRKYGGTGLGLSICKRLVSLMGGQIEASSELGRGTKFQFTITLGPATHLGVEEPTVEVTDVAWVKKPRILVAEDLVLNQKVVTLFLRKLGCTWEVAENGVEVLDLLEREKFDLILMDCQMPMLDGYETSRLIRKRVDRAYQAIPIYALTANAISGDRDRCLEAGMTGYLTKPIRFADLKRTLQSGLSSEIKSELPSLQESVREPGAEADQQTADRSSEALATDRERASIDWSIIGEIDRLGTSGSTSTEVVSLYRENAFKRVEALRLAIREGHARDIRREAHVFKSASSYLGAFKICSICDEIRGKTDDAGFTDFSDLFERLISELGEVLAILDQRYPKAAS